MGAKEDCYRLAQEIVVKRDVFCQRPGCNALADCGHHPFKRDKMGTAFMTEIMVGLCTRCHTGFAHGKPEEFKKFLIERLGRDKYCDARRLSNEVVKNLDYAKIREKLRERLAQH